MNDQNKKTTIDEELLAKKAPEKTKIFEEGTFPFTVAPEKMHEKLSEKRLADPYDVYKELVMIAVNSGAKKISIKTKPKKFSIHFDGKTMQRKSLEDMIAHSAVNPLEPNAKLYEKLSFALLSLYYFKPKSVKLESIYENEATCITLDECVSGKSNEKAEIKNLSIKKGFKITVEYNPSEKIFEKNLFNMHDKKKNKILQTCRMISPELRVNGKKVNISFEIPKKALYDSKSWLPWNDCGIEDVFKLSNPVNEVTGEIGKIRREISINIGGEKIIVEEGKSGKLIVFKNRVLVDIIKLENLPYFGIINNDNFELVLSGNKVKENEALSGFVRVLVDAYKDTSLRRLKEHLEQRKKWSENYTSSDDEFFNYAGDVITSRKDQVQKEGLKSIPLGKEILELKIFRKQNLGKKEEKISFEELIDLTKNKPIFYTNNPKNDKIPADLAEKGVVILNTPYYKVSGTNFTILLGERYYYNAANFLERIFGIKSQSINKIIEFRKKELKKQKIGKTFIEGSKEFAKTGGCAAAVVGTTFAAPTIYNGTVFIGEAAYSGAVLAINGMANPAFWASAGVFTAEATAVTAALYGATLVGKKALDKIKNLEEKIDKENRKIQENNTLQENSPYEFSRLNTIKNFFKKKSKKLMQQAKTITSPIKAIHKIVLSYSKMAVPKKTLKKLSEGINKRFTSRSHKERIKLQENIRRQEEKYFRRVTGMLEDITTEELEFTKYLNTRGKDLVAMEKYYDLDWKDSPNALKNYSIILANSSRLCKISYITMPENDYNYVKGLQVQFRLGRKNKFIKKILKEFKNNQLSMYYLVPMLFGLVFSKNFVIPAAPGEFEEFIDGKETTRALKKIQEYWVSNFEDRLWKNTTFLVKDLATVAMNDYLKGDVEKFSQTFESLDDKVKEYFFDDILLIDEKQRSKELDKYLFEKYSEKLHSATERKILREKSGLNALYFSRHKERFAQYINDLAKNSANISVNYNSTLVFNEKVDLQIGQRVFLNEVYSRGLLDEEYPYKINGMVVSQIEDIVTIRIIGGDGLIRTELYEKTITVSKNVIKVQLSQLTPKKEVYLYNPYKKTKHLPPDGLEYLSILPVKAVFEKFLEEAKCEVVLSDGKKAVIDLMYVHSVECLKIEKKENAELSEFIKNIFLLDLGARNKESDDFIKANFPKEWELQEAINSGIPEKYFEGVLSFLAYFNSLTLEQKKFLKTDLEKIPSIKKNSENTKKNYEIISEWNERVNKKNYKK